jgi:hypothetical protein
MKHSISYSQMNEMDRAKEVKQENRIGIIASILLFAMYCMVSTMDYNDCLKGVC